MEAKSGTSPEEFIPNFNEAFVSAVNAEDGSVADMDVVSGQPTASTALLSMHNSC